MNTCKNTIELHRIGAEENTDLAMRLRFLCWSLDESQNGA